MHPEHFGLIPERAPDRALLDAVHPPQWINPEPRDRYHLAVIGAGTAGLVAAAAAASLGARVALIERALMGGDCLNVGCVPSKSLLRAARAWHDSRSAAAEFGAPGANGAGDVRAAMDRLRRIRARIAPHDGAERFREMGVDVFFGHGRFISGDALRVGDATLRFRRAMIATGTRPSAPPIPGLPEVGYLTNETVFALDQAPSRLVVLGAGPVGCELAQAFSRLGSSVTLVERDPRILPREEAEAAAVIAASLERDGVAVIPGARVDSVRRVGHEIVVRLDGHHRLGELRGDALLVATGRTPNTDGLGLEEAGVRHGRDGIEVNSRLRTSNRRIYAAGDVAGVDRFTHVADAHARLVVANALFFGRRSARTLVIPRCTYTSPELAQVGLTAADAAERGIRVNSITVPFSAVDRAVIEGDEQGFLRVHVRRGSDRIVGATLVATNAGDMISEAVLAMSRKIGLSAIGGTIHPYPTRQEVFRKAADMLRRRKLTPRVSRLLQLYFRTVR